MKILLLSVALVVTCIAGCQSATTTQSRTETPVAATGIKEVSPTDAQTEVAKAYSQFIDVRTPEEYAAGHADRARNIPLDTISANLDQLEKNEPVYLICQTGNRSKKAAIILNEAGFNNVINITGGTSAWEAAKLPMNTPPPHSTKNDEGVK